MEHYSHYVLILNFMQKSKFQIMCMGILFIIFRVVRSQGSF